MGWPSPRHVYQHDPAVLHLAAAAHPPAASQCHQDFWRFWDVLVWVEASIYQMDEDNELLCSNGQAPPQSMIGAPSLTQVNLCLVHAAGQFSSFTVLQVMSSSAKACSRGGSRQT